MKIKNFQGLIVWEKGHKVVLDVYKLTKSFPSDERYGLTAQVRRSAVSICANIAEGYKKSRKDFLRYIDIAQGSLEETKYHLMLSKDLDYCNKTQFEALYEKLEEVGKMLNGLSQRLRF